jgi:cell division protein FtsQ
VARGNRRKADKVPGERRRKLARALRLVLPSVLAVGALAAAGAVTWRVAVVGDALRLRDVAFLGLSRVRPEELLALSPVRRGDHLLAVDPAVVEAGLRRHPWVASAEVRRRLPHDLEVRVVERRAAAVAVLGDLYLVDGRGEVFKRAAPGDGLDLPVITGIEREAWIERREEIQPLLEGALALVEKWQALGLSERAAVAEIHVDADYGTTVTTAAGTEIRLGQLALEDKLSRLSRLLSTLETEGRQAQVIHLDNRRHPEWVAVRFGGAG